MLEAVDRQIRTQAQIETLAKIRLLRSWSRLGPEFSAQWPRVRAAMVADLAVAQRQTIAAAIDYLPAVLAETDQTAPAVGSLIPEAFAEGLPDGGTIEQLVDAPLIRAKVAIAAGETPVAALAAQSALLAASIATVLADIGREVYQTDLVSRPSITGYVRQLHSQNPCSRCIILAGKWFRWNEGFLRHPQCHCIHIPASEDVAGDLTTDPYLFFRSLTEQQQDRTFGKNGADILRHGGDIYRVENIRLRGLSSPRSRQARRFGTPTKRVPVEEIYARGGTREQVIGILREQGYITGPQVRGGNILGSRLERFAQPISRPVVAGSARDRVLTARRTGVRDPLDRDTMTAAERRLYDAHFRLEQARLTGRVPPSVTNPLGLRGSDADRFSRGLEATPGVLVRLERELAKELDRLGERLAAGVRSTGILELAARLSLTRDGRLPASVWARHLATARVRAAMPAAAGGGRRRPPGGRLPPATPPDPPDDWPHEIGRLDSDRWAHILFGSTDRRGDVSGGHLTGYGWIRDTAEFPADWGVREIRDAMEGTIRNGAVPPGIQHGDVVRRATIRGQLVEVRLSSTDGRVIAFYPVV